MKKVSIHSNLLNKQLNFINSVEGIDFNVLNESSEVNNYVSINKNKFKNNINHENNENNKKNIIVNVDSKYQKEICECGSDNLIEDHSNGVLVCRSCGKVLEQILDYNPEWKQYEDNNENNARCSGAINPLLPTSSLGTTISGGFNNRMKIIHNWNSMVYKERSLNNEFKKIQNVCRKNNILKCIEDDTKIMYKMASECKHTSGKNNGKTVITRGKNRISISAACLYSACLKKGKTYTPKEIADFYSIKQCEINKGIKNLRKLIDVNIMTKNNISLPSQFIKRYCDNLQMKNCYADEAINVASNIEKLNIASDNNPFSLAATCILLVAENNKLKNITRKKLASEFDISDVTINKTYKKIEVYKDIIFDKKRTDNISKNITNDDYGERDEIPAAVLEKMKHYGIVPGI